MLCPGSCFECLNYSHTLDLSASCVTARNPPLHHSSSRDYTSPVQLTGTTLLRTYPRADPSLYKGGYTLVTLPRTVMPYCDSGRDSWLRNVTKAGYAVTLRACSVCLSVFGRRIKGMIRLWPEQIWMCNVTHHHRTSFPFFFFFFKRVCIYIYKFTKPLLAAKTSLWLPEQTGNPSA